jgi:hypothetical protein
MGIKVGAVTISAAVTNYDNLNIPVSTKMFRYSRAFRSFKGVIRLLHLITLITADNNLHVSLYVYYIHVYVHGA